MADPLPPPPSTTAAPSNDSRPNSSAAGAAPAAGGDAATADARAPATAAPPASPSSGAFEQLFSVRGKRALVTGASSGIGRSLALRLAKQGVHVVVAARRMDRLATLVQEVEALPSLDSFQPGKAKMVAMDLSASEASIVGAVDEAWAAFGGLDVLVNNAGVMEPLLPSQLDASVDDWTQTLHVNVLGTAVVLRAVAKRMMASGLQGSIINIASMMGTERGTSKMPMYVASKAGVVQMTKSFAIELGPKGIRVNAIAPGPFPSEMAEPFWPGIVEKAPTTIPLMRPGQTDPELAAAVVFFASDASSYVTGTTLLVDGGYTLSMMPL